MSPTFENGLPGENLTCAREACGATVMKVNSAESDLIQRVLKGEVDRFYELVRPCERAIFLAAQSVVRNVADAEEIVQEAVLKALKGLPRFRQEAKFSTWLIQITLNEAKMKLRKDRRCLYESVDDGQYSRDGDYIPKDFADWREIPSEALEQKEIREALIKAVNSLPEKYRTVLVLRDIEQLTIAETAEALGISQANVKTRLSRGRLQLRDALAPSFGETRSRRRTREKVRSLECDPTPVGLGTELRLATENLDQPLALVTNVRTLDTIQLEKSASMPRSTPGDAHFDISKELTGMLLYPGMYAEPQSKHDTAIKAGSDVTTETTKSFTEGGEGVRLSSL